MHKNRVIRTLLNTLKKIPIIPINPGSDNFFSLHLSIIIINYNVKYFLEQCLCAIHKAIEHFNAEVWVVDNASTDGSIGYLKPMFPWVKFTENAENVGFAKANNQALLQCAGKYVLFLNPDTLISEDSLTKCIAFLQKEQKAGALGVRMIDGSGTFLPESKRSFPSPLTSFYKLTGISRLFPSSKIFSRYSLAYLNEFENHEVDVLSGAFMLARKDILLDLNGFDEDFFMYGEDIDLSYRIQKLGYKNFYFSESTIIHFKGESTRKGSLRYIKMFYQAMSIFVKKHYAGRSARVLRLFIQTAILLRAGVSAIITKVSLKALIPSANAANTTVKLKRVKAQAEKQYLTIIAGSEDEYDEVKNLLANAGLKAWITGRASANGQCGNAFCTVDDLPSFVRNNSVERIIFCHGELQYSDIIKRFQDLPNNISVRFHTRGTRSIVGSNSKDTTGECIYANTGFEIERDITSL